MPSQTYSVVHQIPGRLRLRIPLLAAAETDANYMEAWMESVAGVDKVRISRTTRSLVVEYSGDTGTRDAILDRIQAFAPQPIPGLAQAGPILSEVAPLITSAAGLTMLPFLPPLEQKLLTFGVTGSTLLKGVDTLIKQGIKVEVLDALAVGLAAARGEVYTATITGFLLALGEYMEHRTERQSDQLLRKLLRPDPAMAWVERGGKLVQVPGDQVREHELVSVGVGETIPVDGRVIDGMALVNQAGITGEDVPVRKEAPKRVIAGSVLEEGRLQIEATQVGDDTTTARISRFIQESLGKRSETQRASDELADKRVYLTLATGGLVYALTRDLTRLEAVFLVDYSCALKLGTPVAFKSGMFQAASHGVLMKGGAAIEALAAVDTVVFDKTGTLTHSELEVTDIVVLIKDSPCDEQDLLAVVASVEEHASHPVAKAVVDAAKDNELNHITHGEIDYLVAHGMSAEIEGNHIVIGSRHYLEEHKKISFDAHDGHIDQLQNEGKTLLFIGNDQGPVGLIALRDTPREEAPAALARLRKQGIKRLIMITGDRRPKAEALAAELGLDAVYAEMRPEEKAGIIEQLQREGHKVAFVGDGINDGPALVAAEVGIAMPRGADIARATADIVLLDDRLEAVADAHEIATATMRLIKTNFNIAIGVNTAILGGAVMGWLSPVASAVLHNGTTIGILLNALAGGSIPSKEEGTITRLERLQQVIKT